MGNDRLRGLIICSASHYDADTVSTNIFQDSNSHVRVRAR